MGCNQSITNKENIPLQITQETTQKVLKIPKNIPLIDYNQFILRNYLASGGIGIVYLGINKNNIKDKIAMKFFGYNEKEVNINELYYELELFSNINHLDGLVQLKGVFMDSIEGYINNKIHKKSYPVICMEYLEGGDLFDRIQSRTIVSEKFIAKIFKDIIKAIDGLHKIGYIHCDLKLENVMFSTTDEDSKVKLIDFGMMVRLPSSGIYISQSVHGTPGYVAPESLTRGCYSTKSDIWQAGCILYSLLSGFQPFNPYNTQQTIHARYNKMSGVGWDNISSEAKDLIRKIFTKTPENRITCQEILNHVWLTGNAPDENLGEHYYKRIKQLALAQRLKRVFQNHDIIQKTKETKEKLKRILPLIRPNKTIRRTRSNIVSTGPKIMSISLHTPELTNSPNIQNINNINSLILVNNHNSLHISNNNSNSNSNNNSNNNNHNNNNGGGGGNIAIAASRSLTAYSLDDLDLHNYMRVKNKIENDEENENSQEIIAIKRNTEREFNHKITHLTTVFVQHTTSGLNNSNNGNSNYNNNNSNNHNNNISKKRVNNNTPPPIPSISSTPEKSEMKSPNIQEKRKRRELPDMKKSDKNMKGEEKTNTNINTNTNTEVENDSNEENRDNGCIDFHGFISLMMECDLPELATPQMFHIFDINKAGKIDLTEFLVAMVAFRDTTEQYHQQQQQSSTFLLTPSTTQLLHSSSLSPSSIITNGGNGIGINKISSSLSTTPITSTSPVITVSTNQEGTLPIFNSKSFEDNEEIIRFYFNMFDFDNTGTIELEELKLVMRCICTDQSNTNPEYAIPTESDMEAIFEAMAIKNNKSIDYDEFKLFYNTLLMSSSTRSRHDTGTWIGSGGDTATTTISINDLKVGLNSKNFK